MQLEFERRLVTSQSLSNFNPTLVQLELTINGRQMLDIVVFQSHIGAIRMQLENELFELKQSHFNPTLVQLEFAQVRSKRFRTASFQSHIGAIRMRQP